jgi:hypothetical protein
MNMQHWWNDNDGGKTEVIGEKTFAIVALSTTNPTLTGLGLNPNLGSDTLAINYLSHGTAPMT